MYARIYRESISLACPAVLTEDKGYLIDEDITQYTARSTGEGTHDGCYPQGLIRTGRIEAEEEK